MKNIVITGSSRGIGYGLAREFLKSGHRVTISGRDSESLRKATENLIAETNSTSVGFMVCDVLNPGNAQKLWNKAAGYGSIDIWINNAGIGQGTMLLTTMESDTIEKIIGVNITGLINCSRIAVKGMVEQGSGAIYNMEGFGSDGRKMERMTLYGTSKYAVRYFTRSLALEVKDTPVIVSALSPGMVVTDLLINPVLAESAINRRAIRIFHILADRVETVTPFLVKRMVDNRRSGITINWLTSRKIIIRFIGNIFRKRRVEGIPVIDLVR